uniref:Uncharacterized protein n=1 Tax=Oryza glumipatula TaxID=40148 RepID=A0A0D9YWR0_9ORYZ
MPSHLTHPRSGMLADDLRCRNALSGLGKCHPHRAFAAAAAAFASTTVAETELDLASPIPSSSSSSSSAAAATPSLAAGFQNGGHPQTLAFCLPPTAPAVADAVEAAAREEDAATDRDRAIRCSRSMRVWTRPTASPDADEEEDGDAHVQGQGRTCAQLGQRRRSLSRRQCGHTPPPDLATGCFRHRHSSPPPPPPPTATAAFSAFIPLSPARAVGCCVSPSLNSAPRFSERKRGGVTHNVAVERNGNGIERDGGHNEGATTGAYY